MTTGPDKVDLLASAVGTALKATNDAVAGLGGGGGGSSLIPATCDVDVQNVNIAGTLAVTADQLGAGWSLNGNALEYSGPQLTFVIVSVNVSQGIGSGENIQRPAPGLDLLKAGTVVQKSRTGYIRDNTGAEESSNTIYWIDMAPGATPSYSVNKVRESARTNAVNCFPESQFSVVGVI